MRRSPRDFARPSTDSQTSRSHVESLREAPFLVFESASRTTIPFSSPADALVARLRLEHGLDVPTANLFLDILHHPSFKLELLTIRDAADIDLEVATYRANVRKKREQQQVPCSPIVSEPEASRLLEYPREIPYPVLEHILDAIVADDESTNEPMQYQIPFVDTSANGRRRGDRLRSLALVHRTWTLPCQQRLSTTLVARSPSSLIQLLRSPLPGPHTRELVVSLGDLWNHTHYLSGTEVPFRPGGVESDLCCLLERLPRLKSLVLKESGLREDIILSAISGMDSLESLSWHCAHGYPNCDFMHLADTMRTLSKLKALEISGWSFHTASGTLTIGAPARRQLAELRVCISPGDLQLNRVGWLLQCLTLEQRVTKLTLDITLIGTLSMAEVFRNFSGAHEALERLDVLHLINKGGFVEFNLAQARIFLVACTSLRRLHIQGQTVSITEFLDILPASVEVLCFSWFDIWMSPWNLIDSHLPGMIYSQQMPKLRRVVVYNYEHPFNQLPPQSEGAPPNPCPETKKACDQRNIVLDLDSKPPDWRHI